MTTKTLTIQWNEEQLPILPLEPEAHLSFATHDDGNELELTGNRAGLLLLAKAALGMAETIREDGQLFIIQLNGQRFSFHCLYPTF